MILTRDKLAVLHISHGSYSGSTMLQLTHCVLDLQTKVWSAARPKTNGQGPSKLVKKTYGKVREVPAGPIDSASVGIPRHLDIKMRQANHQCITGRCDEAGRSELTHTQCITSGKDPCRSGVAPRTWDQSERPSHNVGIVDKLRNDYVSFVSLGPLAIVRPSQHQIRHRNARMMF